MTAISADLCVCRQRTWKPDGLATTTSSLHPTSMTISWYQLPQTWINLRELWGKGRLRNSLKLTFCHLNGWWFQMGLYALPPKLRNDIHILHAFLQIGFNMSIHQAPGIMPCAKKKKNNAHFVNSAKFTNNTFECFPNLKVDAMCSWWLMCT